MTERRGEAKQRPIGWNLFKTAFEQWYNDGPFQLAAALAYYTLLSLAPLLIILIGIVGLFFGESAAESYIVGAIAGLVGPQSARAVQEIVRNASQQGGGLLATIVGIGLLLFGAGGVVGQLQFSLNTVWGVKAQTARGWWPIIRARFLSYAMLLAIGFLLLVSLVVTTVVSAVSEYFNELLPALAFVWPIVDVAISFALVTILFALIYKVLPDAQIAWRDVWVGAALTSLSFSVGKFLIGLYLGKSTVASAYGAAGSLITVLLWVYYSAVIFFFGAEITRVYATQYGSGLKPTEVAVKTEEGHKKEKTIEQQATPVRR